MILFCFICHLMDSMKMCHFKTTQTKQSTCSPVSYKSDCLKHREKRGEGTITTVCGQCKLTSCVLTCQVRELALLQQVHI